MRAVHYTHFGELPTIEELPMPVVEPAGAVIRVEATGLCRSDWHGWSGHDPDIRLPHVPGHEYAGVVHAVGEDVSRVSVGDSVTVPFVCGCGGCEPCLNGDSQICDRQVQPGFTHWGSFAEFVAVPNADLNVIILPDSMAFTTAAALGCRFSTSYRAVVAQARTRPGEWLVVHGCGGVGLSATMIAASLGARVIAVDVSPGALALAREFGAQHIIDPTATDVVAAVHELTGGGAHVSIDCLGTTTTCLNSLYSLRKRGRHVQVGLMLAEHATPPIPMDIVVARELEIRGSHGMAAHTFAEMLDRIAVGALRPDRLIAGTITLDEAPAALAAMDSPRGPGVTVILPHS